FFTGIEIFARDIRQGLGLVVEVVQRPLHHPFVLPRQSAKQQGRRVPLFASERPGTIRFIVFDGRGGEIAGRVGVNTNKLSHSVLLTEKFWAQTIRIEVRWWKVLLAPSWIAAPEEAVQPCRSAHDRAKYSSLMNPKKRVPTVKNHAADAAIQKPYRPQTRRQARIAQAGVPSPIEGMRHDTSLLQFVVVFLRDYLKVEAGLGGGLAQS